jgi:3-oxoacyl-[acyl-carrier-protein] synthase II
MTIAPTRIGMYSGCARPTFSYWYELFRRDPSAQTFSRRDLMFGVPGQAVGVSASLLEVRGPAYTFTGTCSSAAIALGHAFRDVRSGEIDVAFASGHESSLVPPLFACYRDANLLSLETEDPRRAITPYVGYSTNAFGEGAITFVLERRETVEARGGAPLAVIEGYGYGNNGYHPTTVDVAGVRPAEVLRDLVERSDVTIEDVGFVVGHGNAVQLSDVSEENYMRQLFRERSAEVPLISTKPIYGHLLGASSALNAAAAALMLHHDFVIPTINIDETRTKRGTFHQPNRGVARALSHGVTMSYGLGGHNAALLLKKASK